MFTWFKGKKSKGGSQIFEYDGERSDKGLIGYQEELDSGFIQEREKVYDSLFGDSETVSHEILPMVPHIDVIIYKPGFQGRDFYTLVSSGMSDKKMNTPNDVSEKYSRAEIIMYTNEPKEFYINLIRHFARYPHKYETYLSYGHTIPNGQPAESLFLNSSLDTLVFIPTILSPDKSFTEKLKKNSGKEVQLLHLTPITTNESNLKLEKGMDSLYDLLDKNKHSHILNECRKPYA
jgi:hypothetical protein